MTVLHFFFYFPRLKQPNNNVFLVFAQFFATQSYCESGMSAHTVSSDSSKSILSVLVVFQRFNPKSLCELCCDNIMQQIFIARLQFATRHVYVWNESRCYTLWSVDGCLLVGFAHCTHNWFDSDALYRTCRRVYVNVQYKSATCMQNLFGV